MLFLRKKYKRKVIGYFYGPRRRKEEEAEAVQGHRVQAKDVGKRFVIATE